MEVGRLNQRSRFLVDPRTGHVEADRVVRLVGGGGMNENVKSYPQIRVSVVAWSVRLQ